LKVKKEARFLNNRKCSEKKYVIADIIITAIQTISRKNLSPA